MCRNGSRHLHHPRALQYAGVLAQQEGRSTDALALIERTRLADVLQRNSGVTGLQSAVFFAEDLATN